MKYIVEYTCEVCGGITNAIRMLSEESGKALLRSDSAELSGDFKSSWEFEIREFAQIHGLTTNELNQKIEQGEYAVITCYERCSRCRGY